MSAEEFLNNHPTISHFYSDDENEMLCFSKDVEQAMIDFAKFHVEQALNAQAKLAKRCMTNKSPLQSKEFLNGSYPLSNIH